MKRSEWRSFADAFRGLWILIRSERHARVHVVATVLVVTAGFYFHLATWEWASLILMIAIVFAAEALNTAVEKLGDIVQQEKSESMRNVKDMAAGAVLFTAIMAVVLACVLFIPKIL